jgi:transitional endoplasmic reticulum ATPase
LLTSEPNRHRLVINVGAALLVAGFTYFVTGVLPYYPPGWRWLIILTVTGLWLLRPTGGLLFTLAAYVLPITYSSTTLAAVFFLLFGPMVAMGPYGFLVLATTAVAASMPLATSALLVAPLMAGFLGPRRGGVLGALACLWAEMLALLGGQASAGLLAIGVQTTALVSTRSTPVASLLDFAWLNVLANAKAGDSDSVGRLLQSELLSKLLTPFIERPILLAQVALWAVAAGVIGSLLSRAQSSYFSARLMAVGIGALILGVGHLALPALLIGSTPDINAITFGLSASVAFVALASPVLEMAASTLSPSLPVQAHPGQATAGKEVPSDNWDELAGVDDIKDEALDAIESQFNSKVRKSLHKMSIRPTRGILLFGPPGTGKTKLARIIAHQAKAAFFAVSGTEFTSKYFGESEANLRRIFEEARQSRPAVLFFDEIEAFLPKRTELSRSDAPEKGIVATFLAYTDGIGDLDGVLFIGATNHPDLIDPAALRPGRFDKLIYISPPGREARREILQRYLKDKTLSSDVDLDKLATRMERFTGADIQSVCAEARRWAMQRGDPGSASIAMADLDTAIGGIKPSVTIKMLREYEALADQYGRRSKKADAEDVVAKPILTWNDVAGLDSVKDALREAIELPLAHPEVFKEYGIKPSKGVLLFGPPGCGKTFLAKVVASEAKAHFLHVKGPELLQQAVGQSEAQLRDVFIRARENSPCVLFFDEIDALAGARGTMEASGTKILAQFLTEMDGVEELKGVIVVAATNRPDTLDPAIMRPGRLDRVLYVPPPDYPARLALIKRELAGKPVTGDMDYTQLADVTAGYSAVDITAICNSAAMAAARDALRTGERQPLTMQGLLQSFDRTPSSLTDVQLAEYEVLRDQLQR